MKVRQDIKWSMGLMLMSLIVISMTLLLTTAPAHAVVNCPGVAGVDTDADGFFDTEECSEIRLNDGTVVPYCNGASSDGGTGCLNPDKKDLFVILVPVSSGSLIPATNPLEYISAIGVVTHIIGVSQAGSDRSITPTQKAIKITEDLDTSDITLGSCAWGTPNGVLFSCKLYTKRIENYVRATCGSAFGGNYCVDYYTGTTGQDLINHYIKHTIAHETGHDIKLTATYNSRYGGYHYQTGSGVIMDQSTKNTSKGGKITFYIPKTFASADLTNAILLGY